MAENEQPVTEAPEAQQEGNENVGEFGDQAVGVEEKEKKDRKEFTPLDLGNEDNVSDWIVNMLSGRLIDFAVNNLEWVGEWVDRGVTNKYEKMEYKRQMALASKEAKKAAQKASKEKMANKDGTINASKSTTRVYDENGKLTQLDDYVLQPKDKLVDGEGKPVSGKMNDIEKQLKDVYDRQEAQRQAEQERQRQEQKQQQQQSDQQQQPAKPQPKKKKSKKKAAGKGTKGKRSKGKNGKNAKTGKAPGAKKKEAKKKEGKKSTKPRTLQSAGKTAGENAGKKQETAKKAKTTRSRKTDLRKDIEKTQGSKNRIKKVFKSKVRSVANARNKSRQGAER